MNSEQTINYIYTLNENGEKVYNARGKEIAEIQLKCNLEHLEKAVIKYSTAKRFHKHPRTIGALKKDFFLYLNELKSILTNARENKTVLTVKEEQRKFYNYLLDTYGITV